MRASLWPLAASLLSCGVLLKTIPQRVATLKSSYDVLSPPPLSGLSPNFINILTLGHKAVYDDFIDIWLLQALMDERRGNDSERMMTSIRSVIKHLPKLETIYMLACFTMFQDLKNPAACQEIMLAGLKAFPASWRLPMTQGYVEYFLMKQPAQAASFFMMAASRPDSPIYVQKTVQKLLQENTLSPEDLKRSLEIMSETESNASFIKMLEAFGKLNSQSNPEPATIQP
ncbi:MAG: hypothetical protein NTX25_15435 [Proteobacteria bacterium]|nr:hypothetical protein [Pseudomonadota bacterium]